MDIPSTNRLIASLYSPQWSPMADFKLVYNGSRSMRCAVLTALYVLWEAEAAFPFGLEGAVNESRGCEKESERVRAAGSMSGMLSRWCSSGKRLVPYRRRRRIRELGTLSQAAINSVCSANIPCCRKGIRDWRMNLVRRMSPRLRWKSDETCYISTYRRPQRSMLFY